MPPQLLNKVATVHRAAQRHRSSASAQRAAAVRASGRVILASRRKRSHGPSRAPRVLIEPCFALLALSAVSLLSPEAANAASVSILDVASFLLSHPFWTLVGAGTLVFIIPRIIKAFWRFILWPALFVTVGYTVIKNPDAAVDFVTGIILFSASQPALTSIAILFVFGLFITPYILPVALSAFVLVLLVDPSAFKSLLPAPPPIPRWLLPSPVRQLESELGLEAKYKQYRAPSPSSSITTSSDSKPLPTAKESSAAAPAVVPLQPVKDAQPAVHPSLDAGQQSTSDELEPDAPKRERKLRLPAFFSRRVQDEKFRPLAVQGAPSTDSVNSSEASSSETAQEEPRKRKLPAIFASRGQSQKDASTTDTDIHNVSQDKPESTSAAAVPAGIKEKLRLPGFLRSRAKDDNNTVSGRESSEEQQRIEDSEAEARRAFSQSSATISSAATTAEATTPKASFSVKESRRNKALNSELDSNFQLHSLAPADSQPVSTNSTAPPSTRHQLAARQPTPVPAPAVSWMHWLHNPLWLHPPANSPEPHDVLHLHSEAQRSITGSPQELQQIPCSDFTGQGVTQSYQECPSAVYTCAGEREQVVDSLATTTESSQSSSFWLSLTIQNPIAWLSSPFQHLLQPKPAAGTLTCSHSNSSISPSVTTAPLPGAAQHAQQVQSTNWCRRAAHTLSEISFLPAPHGLKRHLKHDSQMSVSHERLGTHSSAEAGLGNLPLLQWVRQGLGFRKSM